MLHTLGFESHGPYTFFRILNYVCDIIIIIIIIIIITVNLYSAFL